MGKIKEGLVGFVRAADRGLTRAEIFLERAYLYDGPPPEFHGDKPGLQTNPDSTTGQNLGGLMLHGSIDANSEMPSKE